MKRLLTTLALLLACACQAGELPMTPLPGSPQAAGFQLEDDSGRPVGLEDFAGRYLLVNFWATWCAPCREEMPAMQRTRERLKDDGLEILAIHAGPKTELTGQVLESSGVTFPVVYDSALSLGDWNVPGLPTTYLVDPQGRLLFRATGLRDWDSPETVRFLEEVMAGGHRLERAAPGAV